MDIAAIPEHIREWATKELDPILKDAEARVTSLENGLTTLRGVAEESVQMGLDAAQAELARLQSEAPAAAALIEAAEKAVAKWQALLAKLEGAPSGM